MAVCERMVIGMLTTLQPEKEIPFSLRDTVMTGKLELRILNL